MTIADICATLAVRLRDEEPLWGRLPAAMRYKQDLVRQTGVPEAHRQAVSALKVPAIGTLRQRQLRSLRSASRSSADFRPLWEGGIPFEAPPMRIIGKSEDADLKGTSRSAYVARLDDCIIRGRSDLILQGVAMVLHDFENHERTAMADNPEYDPAVLATADDQFWMMEPGAADKLPEVDEAFMLSGGHSLDFGHWITEFLPRLAMARLAGLPPMPVLVDKNIPHQLIESIALVWPECTRTIAIPHLAPLRVKRLWVAPSPAYMGFYPTEWTSNAWAARAVHAPDFARLVSELLRLVPPPSGAGQKLFLARKPGQFKKKLTNIAEIEALASRRGFRILYLQDLSFAEQIDLIRSADFILGPDGSAMLWPLYARPGTRVCNLTSTHTYPLADVNNLLLARGIDYTLLTGPTAAGGDDWPFWNDYAIETRILSGFLDHWLGNGVT